MPFSSSSIFSEKMLDFFIAGLPYGISAKLSAINVEPVIPVRGLQCHVENDFLLIYRIAENTLQLLLIDAGTHSDLF